MDAGKRHCPPVPAQQYLSRNITSQGAAHRAWRRASKKNGSQGLPFRSITVLLSFS
ncbi:hypothetical protein HC341_16050 [Aquisalimonas sp. 2447]|uniref:hypothetical protein n=1 Tax=Aquisalimonas sp. 2447 TaxID=2740807 RepID=UPI0014327848|nr:hypothetical protein [Aquisalimonas sp. 2447]QIT56573.1 hypothetical protein HC341_16050 [Aquisalimonas sp. 2447]